MIRRIDLCLLLLTVSVACSAGWEDVQRITPGHKIEVEANNSGRTRGSFVSANDSGLVLGSKSGEQSIARGDIRRVRIADSSRRIRNGLIGVGIGAGAGFGIGFAVCPHCANEGAAGKYTGPLTGLGAGVGALAGFLPAPYKTVYKAK